MYISCMKTSLIVYGAMHAAGGYFVRIKCMSSNIFGAIGAIGAIANLKHARNHNEQCRLIVLITTVCIQQCDNILQNTVLWHRAQM